MGEIDRCVVGDDDRVVELLFLDRGGIHPVERFERHHRIGDHATEAFAQDLAIVHADVPDATVEVVADGEDAVGDSYNFV